MSTDARTLFPGLLTASWWAPFEALSRYGTSAGERVTEMTFELAVALASAGHADPAAAVAANLLSERSALSEYACRPLPAGLASLLGLELERLGGAVRRVRAQSASDAGGGGAHAATPPLRDLAAPGLEPWAAANVDRLAGALSAADAPYLVATYLELLHAVGNGPAALHPVARWTSGRLVPVAHPDLPDWSALVGLDGPLGALAGNTEALIAGGRTNDCLLYGARGSGKSTAVRGLVRRYVERGLRLVELQPEQLDSLPELVELLRFQPLKFVVFVDDLSFEADDGRYRPLKSLLEGGVTQRPANTALYATSNRRHLVRERLRDRPDPLDDDVHAWDTHHERLALADRFGLVITFPAADQRGYLEVVRALVAKLGAPSGGSASPSRSAEPSGPAMSGGAMSGGAMPGGAMAPSGPELDEYALRFAEWNNGYSGRTARQFVDALVSGRVVGRG